MNALAALQKMRDHMNALKVAYQAEELTGVAYQDEMFAALLQAVIEIGGVVAKIEEGKLGKPIV